MDKPKNELDLRPWYMKQEQEYTSFDWFQLRNDCLEYLAKRGSE